MWRCLNCCGISSWTFRFRFFPGLYKKKKKKREKNQSIRNVCDSLSKLVYQKEQPVKSIGSKITILWGFIKNVNVIWRYWEVKQRVFLRSSKKENSAWYSRAVVLFCFPGWLNLSAWGIVLFLFSKQTDILEHFNFLPPILQCLVQMMKSWHIWIGHQEPN